MKACSNPDCRIAALPGVADAFDNEGLCRACSRAKRSDGQRRAPRDYLRDNDARTTEWYAHFVNGSLI